MPSFRVSRNGSPVCVAGSEALFLVDVRVSGDLWGPEIAHLDVMGSRLRPDETTDLLIWESHAELSNADELVVQFDAASGSRPDPELFVDPSPRETQPIDWYFSPPESEMRKFEGRPIVFPKLRFEVSVNREPREVGCLVNGRQVLAFGLSWVSDRPESARLTLDTYSLRELFGGSPLTSVISEHIGFGDEVSLKVSA
jgi:hypothetical protein